MRFAKTSARDPKRGGSWWDRPEYIISSIYHPDSGGHEPECAWKHTTYKGPGEVDPG
jgi:hypothetical protein